MASLPEAREGKAWVASRLVGAIQQVVYPPGWLGKAWGEKRLMRYEML